LEEEIVILVFLELALMVDELDINEQLVVEEEEGYLYPSKMEPLHEQRGRIIRPK
jgi:hypothetical protein